MTKKVRINPPTAGNRASVSDPCVRVKQGADHVEWQCTKDFVVCFERETPFTARHFFGGNGGNAKSSVAQIGLLKRQHKHFKYCVEVDGDLIDPDIIIEG